MKLTPKSTCNNVVNPMGFLQILHYRAHNYSGPSIVSNALHTRPNSLTNPLFVTEGSPLLVLTTLTTNDVVNKDGYTSADTQQIKACVSRHRTKQHRSSIAKYKVHSKQARDTDRQRTTDTSMTQHKWAPRTWRQ